VFGEIEADVLSRVVQRPLDRPLGPWGQCDVDDGVALAAHQVVVVFVGDEFAQLEVAAPLADVDASDQPCLLQHGQIAIERALHEARRFLLDARDRRRRTDRRQGVHHRLATSGVHVAGGLHLAASGLMELSHADENS
jgi:hypothetical protein